MHCQRIVALDVGERRIGIAVSDPLGLTAQGLTTLMRTTPAKDFDQLARIMAQYETNLLLIGLPRNMDGSLGAQAQRVYAFSSRLSCFDWKIRYWDERLTTKSAHRTLIEADVRRAQRKQVVDKLAAVYILQGFLDAGGWREDGGAPLPRALGCARWRAALPPKSLKARGPLPNGGKRTTETTTDQTIDQTIDQKGQHAAMNGEREDQNMDQENLIELVDEDGKTIRFEHVMTVNYEDEDYVLLSPAEPVEDMQEDEVLVLRIEDDEDGNEVYVSVEDDALVEQVFERYVELANEDEDEDEGE